MRHPTQLYEMAFALLLGTFLWRLSKRPYLEGDIFKTFMISYFAFRLACDFLKPDVRVIWGLSSIQCACVIVLCYYADDLTRLLGTAKVPTLDFKEHNIAGSGNVVSQGETGR
jgi:phosphatidylglycerol:prolipoprotein diacylglycerol transferase